MKLLYFIPSLATSGGIERVLTLKANYLADKFNYQIAIVLTQQKDTKSFFPLSDNIEVINLPLSHHNHNLFSDKRKLKSLIQKEKPDLISTLCQGEQTALSSVHGNIPIIGEIHTCMRYKKIHFCYKRKGFIGKFLGELKTRELINSVKKLNYIIALTPQDQLDWQKYHSNVLCIPNPNTYVTNLASDVSYKRAVSVGRLATQKGYDMLIDAWAFVAEKHPDWILDIYGKGKLKPLLEEKIKSNMLTGKVNLKGTTTTPDQEYLKSSIFVASSRYEGFSLVIAEALTFGVPSVSFDCEWGPGELIQDQYNGFLIVQNDIRQLADRICYLIEHPEERKVMSLHAKERSRNYDPDIVMKQWDDLFHRIINEV